MRHLSLESLIEFAEGRLSPQHERPIEEHIANCADCFAEASEWRALLGLMNVSALENAPDYAVRNCLALYGISKPASKCQRLAAVLFDSAIASATVGIRGVADCQQVVLRAVDVDVHLRIGRKPRIILGQLLQRKANHFLVGIPVRLSLADQQIEATITDRLGEFRFGTAPAGEVRIFADLPSYRLSGDFTIQEEEIN